MKITISYPQVMKMEMTNHLEVPDSISLKEIKEEILKKFWQTFAKILYTPAIGIHGSPEEIVLKDREIEIRTDDDLRDRLLNSHTFQATFKVHTPSHKVEQ